MITGTGTQRATGVAINSEQGFTPDPMYKLMGIFDDSEAGMAAVKELKANGFADDDIELFCGIRGEQTYDFTGEAHGLMARFLRTFRSITYDGVIMDRYKYALREGHCVLMVHINKRVEKGDAVEILRRHKAVQLDYFGPLMTKTYTDGPGEDRYDPDARF